MITLAVMQMKSLPSLHYSREGAFNRDHEGKGGKGEGEWKDGGENGVVGGRCRGCGWYKGKGGSGTKGSGKGGVRVLIKMKCETRESQLIESTVNEVVELGSGRTRVCILQQVLKL